MKNNFNLKSYIPKELASETGVDYRGIHRDISYFKKYLDLQETRMR